MRVQSTSVEHAVVFLPILRFLQALMDGRPCDSPMETSSSSLGQSAEAASGPARSSLSEQSRADEPVPLGLAVEGSGLGVGGTGGFTIIEDDDDEEDEADREADEEPEGDGDGVEGLEGVPGESLQLDIDGAGDAAAVTELSAEVSALRPHHPLHSLESHILIMLVFGSSGSVTGILCPADSLSSLQEIMLMDGADDIDLHMFDGVGDVSDIPEELLTAVAELTGEDANTLRWAP